MRRLLSRLLAVVLIVAPLLAPAPTLAGDCDYAASSSATAGPADHTTDHRHQEPCCCDESCDDNTCNGYCPTLLTVSALPDNHPLKGMEFRKGLYLPDYSHPLTGLIPRPRFRPPRHNT